MPSIAVICPVLGRPQNARPLADSFRASEPDAHLVFVCSPGDDAEIDACHRAAGGSVSVEFASWPSGPGDYAMKTQLGYEIADAPYVLCGADDLRFHPGWDTALLAIAAEYDVGVVGTNDLGNSAVIAGRHSTHPLVARGYIDRYGGAFGEPGQVYHAGYSHNYCNPAEAPIWMGDCSFKNLGDVAVGDVVIGWERIEREGEPSVGTPRRCLAYSEVRAITHREAPLVRVVMESGREFRCTPDHRWLNGLWAPSNKNPTSQWVTPCVGKSLLHVIDVPAALPPDLIRTAGWLAGIYDGEGSGIYVATQSTTHNPEVTSAISAALIELQVKHSFKVRPSGVAEFILTGGRQSYVAFLLRVDPVRRAALEAIILGYRSRDSSRKDREPIGARRFGRNDKIVAVEDAGEDTVFSMTTSTGNYIAWGYASRNCDVELVELAKRRGCYAHCHQAVVEHVHPLWRKSAMDDTYRKGSKDVRADRVLFETRQRQWMEEAA